MTPVIEPFFKAYIACWLLACLVAVALVGRRPSQFEIAGEAYRRYLLQPWKLASFAVAAIGITVIAPYTGDPTWDYYDALLMSVLTFATAPWAVGTLYRALRGQAGIAQAYVALCALLLSASWCYDIYLVFRDGMYPVTWWSNMAASSILYILAGMLWNLEWRPGRGATFGFLELDWPDPAHAGGFAKIAWFALPIMLLAAGLILPFLWGGWG
jgi:hypothetical protein